MPGARIDIGIVTIREDEFQAVLGEFSDGVEVLALRRHYNIRTTDAGDGLLYRVAVMRLNREWGGPRCCPGYAGGDKAAVDPCCRYRGGASAR